MIQIVPYPVFLNNSFIKLLFFLKHYPYTIILFLLAGIAFENNSTVKLINHPGRVIFEGHKKIQEFNLANTGRDSAKYLVSFIEIRMNENGKFNKINEPDSGQYFASSYFRFFPGNITLAPNEAQSVKVQLTKWEKR
jgi:hypothetical protein